MASEPLVTVGWDVGGVQIKAARVESCAGPTLCVQTALRPFEVWRARERLPQVLQDVARELGVRPTVPLALTMTAEPLGRLSEQEGRRAVRDGRVQRGVPGEPHLGTRLPR